MKGRPWLMLTIGVVIGVVLALFALPSRKYVGLLIPGGRELVQNGSFENGSFVSTPDEPIEAAGGKMLCAGSKALDGWQVLPGINAGPDCTHATDAVAWLEAPEYGLDAADGIRFLDLTGYQPRPPAQFGGVSQVIANTQAGATYELSFSIGSSSSYPPPQNYIGVVAIVAGVQNGVMTAVSTSTPYPSLWQRYSMRFTAVAPATPITFRAIGGAGNNGNGGFYLGLDAVSLKKVCFLAEALLGCP